MAQRHRLRPSTRRVRRRALRRLDDAIAALDTIAEGSSDDVADATHRVRTDCKEVRALLRLLRPAGSRARRRVDEWVDEAGSALGAARDREVLARTLAALPAPVTAPESGRALSAPDRADVTRARTLIIAARADLAGWRVDRRSAPVVDGVTAAYRLARRRMEAVRDDPTVERMHDWRRAMKRLTYQVRAIRRWAPSVLRPYAEQLDQLGSLLGEEHDLANAAAHLTAGGTPEGSPEAAAWSAARARQAVLRENALRLGASLLAERPAAFRTRLRGYVRARRAVGSER